MYDKMIKWGQNAWKQIPNKQEVYVIDFWVTSLAHVNYLAKISINCV